MRRVYKFAIINSLMIDVKKATWLKKGKHAFITRTPGMLKEVCFQYGRDFGENCLKIFYGNPMKEKETLDDALWGDHPLTKHNIRKNTRLIEGTQIQNILWTHGISPRVYAVFEVELGGERLACQLTEFVEGLPTENINDCYNMYTQVNKLGQHYGFKALKDITNHQDLINGKFVDPQPFAFEDRPYLEYVKEVYCEKGKYGKIYYQDEPRIGLTSGPRKSEDRIKYLALDKIDFKGKVVWDIGCAGGYFCRYAMDRGAKRVIGLDTKDTLEAAFHVSNYLKYFNIDYVECNLLRGIPAADIPKADIAFFLSMNLHVGNLEQLKEVPFVIFEDNSYEGRSKEVLGEPWTNWFNDIRFIGRGKDHDNKSCFWLRKG